MSRKSVPTSAMKTASFPQWRGGSRWHHRQAGYFGHIVQVVSDFGELVAVRGRLRLDTRAAIDRATS